MPDTAGIVKAFVIGPIGDKDELDGSQKRKTYEEAVQVLDEVILPACRAFGISATRADQIARTGEISEQICRLLRDSEIVIADLTGANANVMYELGLRHTTGKLTVQVGERERLPFDIAAIRTVMFNRTDSGLVEARKKLSQALAEGLKSGGDPVTATRVWFETTPLTDMVDTLEVPIGSEEQDEAGFLEKLADSEEAIQSLARAMGTTVVIADEIARLFRESTVNLHELQKSGGSPIASLTLANRLAALLEDPASRLEVTAGEFDQSSKRMEPGINYLLSCLAADPAELRSAQAREFLRQLRSLAEAADGSIPSTLEFKATIEGLGHAARSLRRVGRRIAATLQLVADSSKRIAALKPLVEKLQNDSE